MGHFTSAATPAASRRPSATATPVTSGNQGHLTSGNSGRSSTEIASDLPGGASQTRSKRPRPAAWCNAISTCPDPPPARASATRSALVDPVLATTRTLRHGRPGPVSAAVSAP